MRRRDAGDLALGAAVGVLAGLAVALVLGAIRGPAAGFETAAASLPTPFVVPTPTPRPELPITLGPDGLGVASFGEQADAVVAELTTLLGAPSREEAWTCQEPPAEVLVVGWADLSLWVVDGSFVGYLDAIHYPPEHGPPLGLATAEGLSLETTLAELNELYEGRLALEELEGDVGVEAVGYRIDGDDGIWGVAEGRDDPARVVTITAGTTCFPDGP